MSPMFARAVTVSMVALSVLLVSCQSQKAAPEQTNSNAASDSSSIPPSQRKAYVDYLTGVVGAIDSLWDGGGLERGQSIVVRCTVLRDGRLGPARIRQSCGVPAIDTLALAVIAKAGPFAPIPDALGKDSLAVSMTLTPKPAPAALP